MKRTKKAVFYMVMMLAAVFLMSGCGKKATPENLMTDINKNLKEIESVSANIKAEMSMEEGGDSLEISMDLDMESTDKPSAAYMKGNVSMKQGVNSLGMDIEGYTVEEDGGYVSYNYADGRWVRTVVEDEEEILDDNVFEELVKHHEDFKLSEDTVEVNGETCLEMKGEVKAEALESLTGEELLESFYSGMDEIEEEAEKITCTIAVYKDKVLPAKIRVDMEDVYMEVTYKEYDHVKEIKVPKEVLEETKGMSLDDEKEDKDDKKGEDDSKDKKVKAIQGDGSLGDSWDSYTLQIEEQVITLPCEIAELEAAGLSLDTEMTPADYIVNAGEDELVYFQDSQGDSIMVSLVNQTEEPKSVEACMVGSISVGTYSELYEGIHVIFPGGIQLGTDMDTVIAAYGEADNEYSNDNYKYLAWYDQDLDKYDNMCYMDFDVETNAVTDITLSCYER